MKKKFPEAVRKARRFAVEAHGDQKYGDLPYVVHLDEVDSVLLGYGYGLDDIRQAAFLHDVLEDCSNVTPETLREVGFSEGVIKMVRFCTDEDGPNRKTRKGCTYQRVRSIIDPLTYNTVPGWLVDAVLVKIADRLANLRACVRTGSTLFRMYLKEQDEFRSIYQLPGGTGNDLWAEYNQLLDGYGRTK